jgi:hypothetical protein
VKEISAVGAVEAPAEIVFDFLADLRTHWELTGRRVRLLDPASDSARTGGRVRMRGPLWIGRSATTEVVRAKRPELLEGRAAIGRRTEATVRWRIRSTGPASATVELRARVLRCGPLDRIVLGLGGRLWLERLFGSALQRLAAEEALSAGASVTRPPEPAPVGPRTDA